MENGEGKGKMAPKLSEDEIDDLLYFSRIGDKAEFNTLKDELCKRESLSEVQLLEAAKDEESGNGILHMAAANGYSGISSLVQHLSPLTCIFLMIYRTPPRSLQIPLCAHRTTKRSDAEYLECTE